MQEKALGNLRVLDLTSHIAGPFCTKLLADWGAEVLKVEAPDTGDRSRREGPFPADTPSPEKSGRFLYLNSNKKSITLNLKDSAGRRLCEELAQVCNVLVEDFPPSFLPSLGLDFNALCQRNPSLVVTSITPFGQTGPYKDWRAEDITLCALSGLMVITGDVAREPLKFGGYQMLLQAGLHAAAATLVAAFARNFTGRSQHVDISMYDCAVNLLGETFPLYTHMKVLAKRQGNRQASVHPMTLLPCQDGFITLLVSREEQWTALVEWVGDPRLRDSRFSTGPLRRQHADEIDAILKSWLQGQRKRELMETGQSKKMPFGAVFTPQELLQDPHLRTRHFFEEIDQQVDGRLPLPGSPVKSSCTSTRPGRAPLLGEHNEEVFLGLLGHSKQDLVRLREIGVI